MTMSDPQRTARSDDQFPISSGSDSRPSPFAGRQIGPEPETAFTPERVERELRKEWWLHHGHTGQYGDDGEMQCGMCVVDGQCGDFKRDPLNRLALSVFVARSRRAAEAMKHIRSLGEVDCDE